MLKKYFPVSLAVIVELIQALPLTLLSLWSTKDTRLFLSQITRAVSTVLAVGFVSPTPVARPLNIALSVPICSQGEKPVMP